MKTLVMILATILIPAFAFAGTVTLAITPSTDDAVVDFYVVEENGSVLTQTCDPGCTEIQLMNRVDGDYAYRVGAVQEYTLGSDPTILMKFNWSAVSNVAVSCSEPADIDPPDITNGNVSCP